VKIIVPSMSRRNFLTLTTLGGIVVPVMSAEAQEAKTPQTAPAPQVPKKRPDPLAPDLVKEFVRAAHVDLDKVKAMLTEQPALLNACWDWSAGDFEQAIGGAGHMGRKDIALYLLDKGARMDLFVAAMLGKLDIVKATLTAFPGLLNSKGPHGIPLLYHAKAGGDDSKPVLEYLNSLGLK
jgi:hypothetical protein